MNDQAHFGSAVLRAHGLGYRSLRQQAWPQLLITTSCASSLCLSVVLGTCRFTTNIYELPWNAGGA